MLGLTVKERQEVKRDLARLGVAGEFIDSWQPKMDCFRHTPYRNISGTLVKPAGMAVPNQPMNNDTALRLARRGVLPTRPSEHCRCKGCRERDWANTSVDENGLLIDDEVRAAQNQEAASVASVTVTKPSTIVGSKCPDCDFVVEAKKRPLFAMSTHRRQKH